MNIKRKNKAFTLAEVLVTLAIIGVVAALTIPSMMMTYKDKETATQLQNLYSDISKAWKMYINDNEGVVVGSFADSSDLNQKFLQTYMSVSEVRTSSSLPYMYQKLNGTSNIPTSDGVALTNGGIIIISTSDSACKLKLLDGFCAVLIVDINGYKAPNRVGYDVFNLYLMNNSLKFQDIFYEMDNIYNTTCIEPGHANWDQLYNNGHGCAVRLMTGKSKWSG